MAWKVDWQVWINGVNQTSSMAPYLTSISTVDKSGMDSDSCSLSFDDTNGQLRLPTNEETILIRLNGVQVFSGLVESVRSKGDRSSGRILDVTGKGVDLRGKAKEGQQFHMDDATLGDFMKKSAEKAGFEIDVHPDLGNLKRDYWSNDRQSFLHLGERMARELSGTFKVRGRKAILVPRSFDLGLPMIEAKVGKNVISWSITPDQGRPKFASGVVEYLDRATGKIEKHEQSYEQKDSKAKAIEAGRVLAGSKEQAEQIANGRKEEAKRKGGKGSLVMDITPAAQAEGLLSLSGARSGVDGIYKMTSVSHKATKSGGSSTSLQIEQPDGSAGKDERKG